MTEALDMYLVGFDSSRDLRCQKYIRVDGVMSDIDQDSALRVGNVFAIIHVDATILRVISFVTI